MVAIVIRTIIYTLVCLYLFSVFTTDDNTDTQLVMTKPQPAEVIPKNQHFMESMHALYVTGDGIPGETRANRVLRHVIMDVTLSYPDDYDSQIEQFNKTLKYYADNPEEMP